MYLVKSSVTVDGRPKWVIEGPDGRELGLNEVAALLNEQGRKIRELASKLRVSGWCPIEE